jgi:hypothetical protein
MACSFEVSCTPASSEAIKKLESGFRDQIKKILDAFYWSRTVKGL